MCPLQTCWNITKYRMPIFIARLLTQTLPSNEKHILEKSLRETKWSKNCLAFEVIPSSTLTASDAKELQKKVSGILFVALTVKAELLTNEKHHISLYYLICTMDCQVNHLYIYCISESGIIQLRLVELKDGISDCCSNLSLHWQSHGTWRPSLSIFKASQISRSLLMNKSRS